MRHSGKIYVQELCLAIVLTFRWMLCANMQKWRRVSFGERAIWKMLAATTGAEVVDTHRIDHHLKDENFPGGKMGKEAMMKMATKKWAVMSETEKNFFRKTKFFPSLADAFVY